MTQQFQQGGNAIMDALSNTLYNTKKNSQQGGVLYVDSGQGKELAHENPQAFNPPPSMAGILPKAEIIQGVNPLDGQPSDDFDENGLPITEDGYAMMSIYNDIAKANGVPVQNIDGQQDNQDNNIINANNVQAPQGQQQFLSGGVQALIQSPQAQPIQTQAPTGLKSGIHDFLAGFGNNYNNSITEGNFYGDTQDQFGRTIGANKMGRAGEIAGSLGRMAQNPLVQGLIATLIAKKVNPMNDIGRAAEFGFGVANNAGQSNVNKDILRVMGYPVETNGVFNKVSDKAVKAVYQDNYNKGRITNQSERNLIDRLYKEGLLDVKNGELVLKRDALGEKIRHNKQTESIGRQNASTNAYRASEYGRHNRVQEGINQQNADTGIYRAKTYNADTRHKQQMNEIKNGLKVVITTPDGQTKIIPSSAWDEAKKRGAKLNE